MENKPAKSANVFAGRNYRLVFFGALVSELGALLYSFAVGFYILEISDNNAFLQGLYLALCGVVRLLFTPVGGVLGDRFNKGKIMFLCDYAKGGVIIGATLLMLLFPSNTAHIVVLFLMGILGNAVSGIFSPASGALLPHIVAEDKLQQAFSYFSVRSSLESIFGVVLAGVLYAAMPIIPLFFLVGVCYVLSGVSEMFIRYEHKPPREKLTLRLALADMAGGLRYLKTQKAILALCISILFVNFFFSPLGQNFLPYFVKTDVALAPGYLFQEFLTPELWTSVFSVLIGVSSLAGSVILSAKKQADKMGRKTALNLCGMAGTVIALAVCYGLFAFGILPLNAFLILFCLGCVAIGFLVVGVNIPVNTALMRLVDEDKRSKISSIVSVLTSGLVPIAAVLAGAVLQLFGSTWLLAVCAAGFTASALMMLLNKHVREI